MAINFSQLKNNQSGFTLVELVIALSVFTVGIMAAFTLSLANINAAEENYQDILAANLAREGIELVRNIRDNNWLKIEANEDCDGNGVNGRQICTWREGLSTSDVGKVAYNSEEFTALATYDLGTCYTNGTCRLYRDTNNFYDHNNANASTNLARIIYLTAMCMDASGNITLSDGLGCAPATTWVGINVVSKVRWYRGTKYRDIQIVDNIYNWRDYND